MRINNQYVPILLKNDVQKLIDSISASATTSVKPRYGPSLCKSPLCANMRLYDGRYHSFQCMLDASTELRLWSPGKDLIHLSNATKSREFSTNRVRMLTMLQARTPYSSRNIETDPKIILTDYINMYEQEHKSNVINILTPSLRKTTEVASKPSEPIDMMAPMLLKDLMIRTMSSAQITQD